MLPHAHVPFHCPHERCKAAEGSSLEMAKLRATLLNLVPPWPPTGWAKTGWEERAHQASWCLLRSLLPPLFLGSVLDHRAMERWHPHPLQNGSAKYVWQREKGREAEGEVSAETWEQGRAYVCWLKFKSTNQCDWKTGRKWRGRWRSEEEMMA